MHIHSKAITDSAKGERCTLRIPGYCTCDRTTTVFCHFDDISHGMTLKSHDIIGAYGCVSCHDIIDRRNMKIDPETKANLEKYKRFALQLTIIRMIEKGLITVKQNRPKRSKAIARPKEKL